MKLLQLLQMYHPTPEELDTKERMISFVQNHPDCFERTLEIRHVTGSAWLISRDGASVLLTHHAKFDQWMQLGGHSDGETDVLQTALREAREESGIEGIVPVSNLIFDIDIHQTAARGAEKAHLHYDVRFLLRVTSSEEFKISPESKKLQWFGTDPAKLPTQSLSVRRMFEKWLKIIPSIEYVAIDEETAPYHRHSP